MIPCKKKYYKFFNACIKLTHLQNNVDDMGQNHPQIQNKYDPFL